ncbi:unnamed protein product, partial [Mesorhabditis spiculigera]
MSQRPLLLFAAIFSIAIARSKFQVSEPAAPVEIPEESEEYYEVDDDAEELDTEPLADESPIRQLLFYRERNLGKLPLPRRVFPVLRNGPVKPAKQLDLSNDVLFPSFF